MIKQMIKMMRLESKHARLVLAAAVALACFFGARAEQDASRPHDDRAASVDAGLAGGLGSAALAVFGSELSAAGAAGPESGSDRKPAGKSKAGKANKGKNRQAPSPPNANGTNGGAAAPAAAPPPPRDPNNSEKGSGPLPSRLGLTYGEIYWGEEFMSYARQLNVRRVSLPLHWIQVEPADDQFNFALVDAFLDQLEPNDEALIVLYTSSNWGAEGIGKGCPPLDLEVYKSFVFEMVSHCQGKVKYWQRDTEPFSPRHWPIERWLDYLYTQVAFYEAVKSADPEALVIAGGHGGHWVNGQPGGAQLYTVLLQYGHPYFDMVDIHLYEDPYTIPERVAWFRNKMQQLGISKPIVACEYGGPHPCQFPKAKEELTKILTEWSNGGGDQGEDDAWRVYLHSIRDTIKEPSLRMFLDTPPADLEARRNRIHARDLVQRTMLILSSGVRLAWYWDLQEEWPDGVGPHPYFGKLRLVDPHNDSKEPAFDVYLRMVDKLGGLTAAAPLDSGAQDVFLFRADRGSRGDLYVIWQKRPAFEGEDMDAIAYAWASPWSSVKVTDVFGSESELNADGAGVVTLDITDTPLFLEEAGAGD